MKKLRRKLYKIIKQYGISSNEAIQASKKLEYKLNKKQKNINIKNNGKGVFNES